MADLLSGLGSLGGLGGLVKGLTSIMPQDDPGTQLLKAQSEVSELKQQETEIYVEIGKAAVEKYGLEDFGEAADRMKLIQANLVTMEAKLQEAQSAKEQKEKTEKEALAGRTCPQCGYENPEGTKFCQECGSKLGVLKPICSKCGAENLPGVKFCQECGAKMTTGEASAACPSCGVENPPGTRF